MNGKMRGWEDEKMGIGFGLRVAGLLFNPENC